MINFPSAVVLCVVSAISCTALVGLSSGSLDLRNSTARHSDIHSAIGSALAVHGPDGEVGDELCFSGACAEITAITEGDGIRTVTMTGTDDGGRSITRIRGYTKTTASHLAGTDAGGNPVWVTEADAGTYTWHTRELP